jgi:Fur family transcriptional regulator, ferric uptake regulator
MRWEVLVLGGGERSDRVMGPVWSGRNTWQRVAVLRVLARSRDFVSAQNLHARLAADGMPVGLTTVYRALRDLEECGRADVVRDETGERLYRMRAGAGHRHYLICRCCGRSRPVDSEVVEEWADRVAEETGYSAVEHTVELSGVCGDCGPVTKEGETACQLALGRPGARRNCSL